MLSQITIRSLGAWTRLNKTGASEMTVSSAAYLNRERSLDHAVKPSTPAEMVLTQGKLLHMAKLFTLYDTKGEGGLNIRMFRKVMQKFLSLSDQEADFLFMKVDTNCNGRIDWDEFMVYYFHECVEKELMHKSQLLTFPGAVQTHRTDHRDSIIRVLLMPTYLSGTIDPTRGQYITVGRAGVISYWTVEFHHRFNRQVKSINRNKVWVTDAVCFQHYHLMAVCTTNEDIQFFNTNASRFERICRVIKLPACPLRICCLDEHYAEKDESALFWGDADGNILAILFKTTPLMTPINPFRSENQSKIIVFNDILEGKVPLIQGRYRHHVHNSEVIQIMHAPHLNSIISACSKDYHTAVYLGDVDRNSKHCHYFKINRGVLSFDYCDDANLLVTGGLDSVVRIYNVYEPRRPISMMHGHQSHVISVFIDSAREIVISMGQNKDVRVYGIHTLGCTQFIHHTHMPEIGRGGITSAFYNPYRRSLVWASTVIFVLEEHYKDMRRRQIISHEHPVCVARHNTLYGQVVSADVHSDVHIWNLDTGLVQMRFNAASEERGRDQLSGITSMSFDPSLRLLVTGACDGCVRMWNFSNGHCLREFSRESTQRVTAVHSVGRQVLAAGWNRQLTIHEYDVTKNVDDIPDSCKTLSPPHADDILSMDFYPPDIIATSSYDGRIFMWALRTSHLMFMYHVRGLLPADRLINNLLQHKLQNIAANSLIDKKPPVKTRILSRWTNPIKIRRARKLAEQSKVRKAAFGNLPADLTIPTAATNIDPCKVTVNRLYTTQRDSVGNAVEKVGLHSDPSFGTSVEQLLFLRTRPLDIHTATLLSSCADGIIRAWSARFEGGLIGEFYAAHRAEEPVVAMTSCEDDKILVTGDTLGYIKLWDISHYAIDGRSCSAKEHDARAPRWKLFEQFLHWVEALDHIYKLSYAFPFMSRSREGDQPHLLLSFRAHRNCINSVDYFQNIYGEFLISASMDCSVRLWTITGMFLGIFGQSHLWTYNRPSTEHIHNRYKSRGYVIPPDIRPVASSTTLKVMNQYSRCKWLKLSVFITCAVHFKAILDVIKHRDYLKTIVPLRWQRSRFLERPPDDDRPEDYEIREVQADGVDSLRTAPSRAAPVIRDKALAEEKKQTESSDNLTNIVDALGTYAVAQIKLLRKGTDVENISITDKYVEDDVIWKYFKSNMHNQEIPKVSVPTDILQCPAFTAMTCLPVEYTDYSEMQKFLADIRERYDRIKRNHPSVEQIVQPRRPKRPNKINLRTTQNSKPAQTNV